MLVLDVVVLEVGPRVRTVRRSKVEGGGEEVALSVMKVCCSSGLQKSDVPGVGGSSRFRMSCRCEDSSSCGLGREETEEEWLCEDVATACSCWRTVTDATRGTVDVSNEGSVLGEGGIAV